MYICEECGLVFDEPRSYYNESEYFGRPVREEYTGCPHCGGNYIEYSENDENEEPDDEIEEDEE